MIKLLVLSVALTIIIVDIKSHRIPNRLTIVLMLLLLFDSTPAESRQVLIAVPVAITFGVIGKFGAGDIKLFSALVATSSSLVISLRYFYAMAAVSLVVVLFSALISFLRRAQGGSSIAFAPSILAPFLVLYLAI